MIINQPISIERLLAGFTNEGAGALVVFAGTVRGQNKGKKVWYLEYEAFKPLADKMIAEITASAKMKFGLLEAVCIHRAGRLEIGDTAVAVLTLATHRREAYLGNQFIIDRVKHEAPVWKKEYWSDGTAAWGHNCDCSLPHKDLEEHLLYHPL